MKIGIVGCGVVGSTLKDYLNEYKPDIEWGVYDPLIGYNDDLGFKDDVKECKILFIAVPVEVNSFKQDLSLLEESFVNFPGAEYYFIRSFVNPGTCEYLSMKYKKKVISMPEFLTERRAYDDFLSHPTIIGMDFVDDNLKEFLIALFNRKKDSAILFINSKEAEMVKITHNVFGAVKVTYFNAIAQLCETKNIDFDVVRKLIGITGFINKEHTQVPGPDGQYGFAGKCFPTNLLSMIGFAGTDISHNLWACVHKMNEFYRTKAVTK